MLIIRLEFFTKVALYQKVPLLREIGNDCLSEICRKLLTRFTSTRVNRKGKRSFTVFLRHLLAPGYLWLSITSCPFCFRFSLTSKKPEFCTCLRCFFRLLVHHLLSLLAFWIKSLSLYRHLVTWLIGCHVASGMSLDSVTLL